MLSLNYGAIAQQESKLTAWLTAQSTFNLTRLDLISRPLFLTNCGIHCWILQIMCPAKSKLGTKLRGRTRNDLEACCVFDYQAINRNFRCCETKPSVIKFLGVFFLSGS